MPTVDLEYLNREWWRTLPPVVVMKDPATGPNRKAVRDYRFGTDTRFCQEHDTQQKRGTTACQRCRRGRRGLASSRHMQPAPWRADIIAKREFNALGHDITGQARRAA